MPRCLYLLVVLALSPLTPASAEIHACRLLTATLPSLTQKAPPLGPQPTLLAVPPCIRLQHCGPSSRNARSAAGWAADLGRYI
jgi:hypothetical protein